MPTRHLTGSVFALYRLIGLAAGPLVRRHMRQRCARGREDPARIAERFGRSGTRRPPGALVWIHGASIGESLSALPMIDRLRADWPSLNLLVTTGTVTSAKLMAERLPAGVVHQYLPVDLPAAVDRFLDHWRPALGLIIESELWPSLLLRTRARGIDLVLVNGRVSPKSFSNWRRVRPLVTHLLGVFSLTLAQSRQDLSHLTDLGAVNPRFLGNLKFAAAALAADTDEVTALQRVLDGRPRWLAASTHPGEDEIAAEVHAALAPSHPALLTIIAPRHPQRGADAAAQLRAQGRRVALRSAGEAIEPETEIYVADTVGEMGLWYRLAEVVLVGGSLVPKGGQNVLEPAKLGCAVLAGPHTTNFRRVSEDMTSAGALRRVADGAELAAAVGGLLGDDDMRAAMIASARDYAAAEAGVLDDIIGALAPHLDRAAASEPALLPD